jgi:hypothetical protein
VGVLHAELVFMTCTQQAVCCGSVWKGGDIQSACRVPFQGLAADQLGCNA